MGFNKGISANIKLTPGNKSGGVEQISQILSKVKGGIQIGRVTDIILNGNYPDIEKYGGLNSIGTIFFELNNIISDGRGIAKPFFPQISAYPLVNEMVLIFKLPNTGIGKTISDKSYYYINMISLWNHPHHNAYPNPLTKSDIPPYQQKDYQQTEAGSVRRVGDLDSDDQSTDIDLNSPINTSQDTFIERINIHPLLPFAGDVIYEGRWGNSIRFGSTAKPKSTPPLNTWSETGKNGDPITIIRNGQSPNSSDEGWVPITENVNDDLSSIYATSTQKIPIETINNEFTSYNDPPELPNLFTNPQVIINSDRLVFNAKTDSVLLSAEKSIFLGANSSLNFNAGKNVVMECSDIKLGDNTATEPLIKGDIFLKNLDVVLTKLDQLCTQLSVDQIWPAGAPVANGGVITVATSLKVDIANFKANMSSYKSKVSKTK
jgi:hypothetical protein